MRLADPRLLRHARAVRGYLVTTVAAGLAGTALILAQAGLLARALATAGRSGGAIAPSLAATLVALVLVVAARVLRDRPPGEIATLATRGLDGLDPFFARYVPQLVLAVLVPVAVVARVAAADWISALLIAATLPLIPLFAVLVGWHTKARTQRQWRLLATLGGHFLDVVEGLPTLKIFGRARAQEQVIGRVTGEYRTATMSALRVAFLSALVLELAAAIATALVAVEVGLRLLYGHMAYETALLVLLLTPEAFLPLRAVGAQFHASMEGAAAAGRVLDILDAGPPADARPVLAAGRPGRSAAATIADLRREEITLTGITVTYPGRSRPALDAVDLTIRPGERLLVTGPSGAGKSTLLALLLGFVAPAAGTLRAGGADLAAIGDERWRAQIAWVPQQPHLFAGSVADSIALGRPDAGLGAIRAAARLAGADGFIEALPGGYAAQVGERALRLSAGQRQKIALARAFLRDAPLVLLDEPAAHLDPASARWIAETIETRLAGRTVILVSHGPGLAALAGRAIRLDRGRLTAPAVPPLVAR